MKDYFGSSIKKLGFGFMRLPTHTVKGEEHIKFEMVKPMVDLYIKRGFTYFDTAYDYNKGESEIAVRKTVTERYPRDSFQVTTKLPSWKPLKPDEMKSMTQTSLDRTGLDFFDLYLLHGIDPTRFGMIKRMKAWDYLRSMKESGKAKNIGFSYHGDGDSLNSILDTYGEFIDIVQLQINYIDWESQAKSCYKAAIDHEVGIIVMSPVKGGSLANFTPEVAGIFKEAHPNASVASWALRFAMNLEGVVTVLSGMSTIEQVDDNTTIADTTGPLSKAESSVIANAMDEMAKIPIIPCTMCRYCVPDCPRLINSPGIINLLNDYKKYRSLQAVKGIYGALTGGEHGHAAKSSDCVECGVCESRCPQRIKIMEAHKEAIDLFEN